MASGGDGSAVRRWQQDLSHTGVLTLPSAVRRWIGARVRTVSIGDEETLQTIRNVHLACGYVMDPHTAVGVAGSLRSPFEGGGGKSSDGGGSVGVPGALTVCLGCAHAVKFLPAVANALHLDLAAALEMLLEGETHPCVRAVGAMARELQRRETSTGGSATAVGPAVSMPAGCTAVLRQGEDWEARLRQIVSSASKPASKL